MSSILISRTKKAVKVILKGDFFTKILALYAHYGFKLLGKNLNEFEVQIMKKYLKLVSAVLSIIGVVMMFFPQVVISWTESQTLSIEALVGGSYNIGTEITNPVYSGLAGYILLGVAALILLVVALVPFFKEHEILSAVVTGLAVACAIVGAILIFLIRKNFDTNNGPFTSCYVGWGMIAAGSLGSLSALVGAVSIIFDINGSN